MKCVEEGGMGVLKVFWGAERVVSVLCGHSMKRQGLTVGLRKGEEFCYPSEMFVVRREKEQKRLST